MTAQISEQLIFEGETVPLFSNPLDDYFALGGHNPGFEATSTALWRGYVGTWEIQADRLYLIKLWGHLEGGGEATIESVFPGYAQRVFAHWFSGTLRIPQGGQIQYVHAGYSSIFERDVLLTLRHGVVVAQQVRYNSPSLKDAPRRYDVGGLTVWPARREGQDP